MKLTRLKTLLIIFTESTELFQRTAKILQRKLKTLYKLKNKYFIT